MITEEFVEPELLFVRPELLIHPNIPKPLHGIAPRTLMKASEWDKVRREAYAKNNYHCWACGTYRHYDVDKKRFDDPSFETLDCHEFYEIDYEKKRSTLLEFVALCKNCHNYIHSGRMNSMYDKGELNDEDCYIIRSHGDSMLLHHGFGRTSGYAVDNNTYEKEWGEWKLCIDNKEYGSIYCDYWDWYKHYMIK